MTEEFAQNPDLEALVRIPEEESGSAILSEKQDTQSKLEGESVRSPQLNLVKPTCTGTSRLQRFIKCEEPDSKSSKLDLSLGNVNANIKTEPNLYVQGFSEPTDRYQFNPPSRYIRPRRKRGRPRSKPYNECYPVASLPEYQPYEPHLQALKSDGVQPSAVVPENKYSQNLFTNKEIKTEVNLSEAIYKPSQNYYSYSAEAKLNSNLNNFSHLETRENMVGKGTEKGKAEKKKVLEMMSHQFNASQITGQVKIDYRRGNKMSRMGRPPKRKSFTGPEGLSKPLEPQTPLVTHNPVTPALKKAKVSSQPSGSKSKRNASGSEKESEDSNEIPYMNLPEATDSLENSTRRKMGRPRKGNFSVGAASSPLSAVGVANSPDVESHRSINSKNMRGIRGFRRGRGKGRGRVESLSPAVGRESPRSESSLDSFSSRQRRQPRQQSLEDYPSDGEATNQKGRSKNKPSGSSKIFKGGAVRRSRAKTISDRTYGRRSMTPVTNEIEDPPADDLKSKRFGRPVTNEIEDPPADDLKSKRFGRLAKHTEDGQTTLPISLSADSPVGSTGGQSTGSNKASKKKRKKYFKGLKYSFGKKKKKPLKKSLNAQGLLDNSQETESLASEDVDADSFDSSSQDLSRRLLLLPGELDPYDPSVEFDDSQSEKSIPLSLQQQRKMYQRKGKGEEEDTLPAEDDPDDQEEIDDEGNDWGVFPQENDDNNDDFEDVGIQILGNVEDEEEIVQDQDEEEGIVQGNEDEENIPDDEDDVAQEEEEEANEFENEGEGNEEENFDLEQEKIEGEELYSGQFDEEENQGENEDYVEQGGLAEEDGQEYEENESYTEDQDQIYEEQDQGYGDNLDQCQTYDDGEEQAYEGDEQIHSFEVGDGQEQAYEESEEQGQTFEESEGQGQTYEESEQQVQTYEESEEQVQTYEESEEQVQTYEGGEEHGQSYEEEEQGQTYEEGEEQEETYEVDQGETYEEEEPEQAYEEGEEQGQVYEEQEQNYEEGEEQEQNYEEHDNVYEDGQEQEQQQDQVETAEDEVDENTEEIDNDDESYNPEDDENNLEDDEEIEEECEDVENGDDQENGNYEGEVDSSVDVENEGQEEHSNSAKEEEQVVPTEDDAEDSTVIENGNCESMETSEQIKEESEETDSKDVKDKKLVETTPVKNEVKDTKPEDLADVKPKLDQKDATMESKDLNGVYTPSSNLSGGRRVGSQKRRLEEYADKSEDGVRKSKRLNRIGSSHPLAIAAPAHGSKLETDTGLDKAEFDVADPSLTNVLCKCRVKENPKAVNLAGDIYCQAIDSFDGRIIGCCNIVSNHRYLRVSGKIPYMLLCTIHRQRIRRHNCCPGCGLFCTQGIFVECRWDKLGSRHYYHKLCGLQINGMTLCPHCGTDQPGIEVHLELKLSRKPIVYLKQHQEKKGFNSSARMSLSKTLMVETEPVIPPSKGEEDLSTLELPDGKVISPSKLPVGLDRDRLSASISVIKLGKQINVKPAPKGIYWSCKQGDLEKLLHVLLNGVSPNAKVKEYGNQCGLHTASTHGCLPAIHILVSAGASLDLTDSQLQTPLMIAIMKNHNDIVNYLIQAGANLNAKTQDSMTCLHLAAKSGNYVACRHILDSGRLSRHSINIQDEGGWTPLVWASENRCINVVKILLDRGANPQICDVEQNTALHWAAFSGSTHICSMVLDRGCSLRSMNAIGDTPLHIAARQNHVEAVVLLLARGALLDIQNTKGQTPLDCAFPESDVFLQLTLNKKLRSVLKENGFRNEKILSSDIAAGKEAVPIPIVNGIDDEGLPKDYIYISENCEALNVNIDRTMSSLKWCDCEDGCNSEHCICSQLNFQCWYDPEGKLLPDFNYADPPMIFECNRACGCSKLSCHNRVVQHGMSSHLQLFKTKGKGWGVRALKTIEKGSYVCEYVGEIITDLEADLREDDSYLFDLDNRDSETFCIDARQYGNVARFINHLCEANLTPVKMFIDHQDLVFPRIAFFANRDIFADEELGFDYGEKFWIIKYKHFTCTCDSPKCKYSSETIQTTLENYNKKIKEHQKQEKLLENGSSSLNCQ